MTKTQSTKATLSSKLSVLEEIFINKKGFWRSPENASPRSSAMLVRRKYCKSPNTSTIGALPIPTVKDLTRFQ